jgi:TetR/AcrR family transcriptional regulator
MSPKATHIHRRDRAEQTRAKILRAAVREFSAHGLSGARTDAIAELAGANKALLYYYFKSKNGLYAAAIKEVSTKVVEGGLAALDPEYSAGERLLRSALNHFDRILTQREFQSLMQQEMVRFRSGERGSMKVLFQTAFKPLVEKLQQAVDEGIRTGELCEMEGPQVVYSMFGANAFYFLSAPLMQLALPIKPFEPEVLRQRRRAAVEFLGMALFTDRAHGMRLAKRVLQEMPMPRIRKIQMGFQVRRKSV